MKFDEVYEFYKSSPVPTTLNELELALYYLSEMYSARYREWRFASIPGLSDTCEVECPIEATETIDFTREDIIEYLVSEGSRLDPNRGETGETKEQK